MGRVDAGKCLFVGALLAGLGLSATGHASHHWARTIGAMGGQGLFTGQQTGDGGYVLAGATAVENSDYADAWIVKLDAAGDIVWQKRLGGPDEELANTVRETRGGGYIVAGETYSDPQQLADTVWLVELDSEGQIEWRNAYGGASYDQWPNIEVLDAGYILAFESASFGAGDEIVTMLLTGTGGPIWAKRRFVDGGMLWLPDIKRPSAGEGYGMVATAYYEGDFDVWFVRMDETGQTISEHLIRSEQDQDEYPLALSAAADGGWFVAGYIRDVPGGGREAFCMKLGATGAPLWQKRLGGAGEDRFGFCASTSDGGCVAVGGTSSSGAGSFDLWVVQFSSAGEVLWQKTYGGAASDGGSTGTETSDGGLLIGGYTSSYEADSDGFALRLSGDGEIDPSCGELARTATLESHDWSVTDDDEFRSSIANVPVATVVPEYAAVDTEAGNTALCVSLCQVSCSATVPQSGIVGLAVDFAGSGTLVDCGEGVVSYSWNFGDGSTSTEQNPSHTYLAPGDYGWTLTVTAPGASPCTQTGMITISAMAQADLTGAWTSISRRKRKVNATFSCQNIGLGDAGSFTVKIYSSKKSTISKKSKLIGTQAVSSLDAGGSYPTTFKATLHNGHKYLIALVDSSDSVAETNEGNNIVTASIP